MIEAWKVKRELGRMRQQLHALVTYPLEPFFKWRHDRSFYKNVSFTNGETAMQSKAAIYLMYQPRGVLESSLDTCRHLFENGYSVLVVSNAAVSETDKTRLAPHVWRIAERPNYGYDFGGYRDGVRILRDAEITSDALIIMNDSIWWPIFDKDTVINQMEQSGFDLGGIVLHDLPRKKASKKIVESYFFWLGKKSLQSAAFDRYWKKYRISNSKHQAIHRGERSFTNVLVEDGLTCFGLVSRETINSGLMKWDNTELKRALHYAVKGDLRNKDNPILAQESVISEHMTPEETGAALQQIAAHGNFHAPLSYACIKNLGASVLKKSAAESSREIYHLARSKVLAAVEAGDLPPLRPAVLREIRDRQRGGASAVGR